MAKQATILKDLRRKIVTALLGQGARLPTRFQLLAEYQVSMSTVQGALDRLVEDGFVVPRGRAGTFVSPRPPHLCRYGLVFPSHPGDRNTFGGYWQVLANVA